MPSNALLTFSGSFTNVTRSTKEQKDENNNTTSNINNTTTNDDDNNNKSNQILRHVLEILAKDKAFKTLLSNFFHHNGGIKKIMGQILKEQRAKQHSNNNKNDDTQDDNDDEDDEDLEFYEEYQESPELRDIIKKYRTIVLQYKQTTSIPEQDRTSVDQQQILTLQQQMDLIQQDILKYNQNKQLSKNLKKRQELEQALLLFLEPVDMSIPDHIPKPISFLEKLEKLKDDHSKYFATKEDHLIAQEIVEQAKVSSKGLADIALAAELVSELEEIKEKQQEMQIQQEIEIEKLGMDNYSRENEGQIPWLFSNLSKPIYNNMPLTLESELSQTGSEQNLLEIHH